MCRVLRHHDNERALKYSQGVSTHLDQFRDRGSAIRAFLNELAISQRVAGQTQNALGFAAMALHDGVGYTLDSSRAGYALVSSVKSSLDLRRQSVELIGDTPESFFVLLERIEGPSRSSHFLRNQLRDLKDLTAFRAQSASQLILGSLLYLSRAAISAVKATGVGIGAPERLSFTTLARIAPKIS